MKCGNAAGNDGIFLEITKACEELGIDKISDIANRIYDSGVEMKESLFIHQKGRFVE